MSFRSFLCRLRYIVHKKNGVRCRLSPNLRGINILHTKSYDAYVFVREVKKHTDAKIWLVPERQENEACLRGVLSALVGAFFFNIVSALTMRDHRHLTLDN